MKNTTPPPEKLDSYPQNSLAKKRLNKILLILIIVFSVLTVAFSTTLIVSSVKLDYAENHYEVSFDYSKVSIGSTSVYQSGYGCGEMDCEYCNGKKYAKEFSDFVFYKMMSSLKTASIIILSVSAGIAVVSAAFLIVDKLKKNS